MATQLFEISRAISANALGLAFALTILFMVVAIFVPRSSLETGKGVAFSLAMVLHVLMVVIMLIAVAAYAVSSRWIYVLAPLAAVALSAKAINWILDKRENKEKYKMVQELHPSQAITSVRRYHSRFMESGKNAPHLRTTM